MVNVSNMITKLVKFMKPEIKSKLRDTKRHKSKFWVLIWQNEASFGPAVGLTSDWPISSAESCTADLFIAVTAEN